eukprot:scaffold2910_cov390-Prasinococcus_capsulatus_cf.AAC.47
MSVPQMPSTPEEAILRPEHDTSKVWAARRRALTARNRQRGSSRPLEVGFENEIGLSRKPARRQRTDSESTQGIGTSTRSSDGGSGGSTRDRRTTSVGTGPKSSSSTTKELAKYLANRSKPSIEELGII